MNISDIVEGVPMGYADINSATKFQYSMGFEIELLIDKDFIETGKKKYDSIKQNFMNIIDVHDVVSDISIESSRYYSGAEVISKPYNTIDEGLHALKNALAHIDGSKYKTNESCGLHVTVGKFTKQEVNSIDLLKFFLLINGDRVLSEYDRNDNNFCDLRYINEVLDNIKEYHHSRRSKFDLYKSSIPKINQHFLKLAKSVDESKYSIINLRKLMKDGLIEIRAFGNTGYENKFPSIEKHVRYIIRALDIARDPNAYRKEYLKKIHEYLKGKNKSPSQIHMDIDTFIDIKRLFDVKHDMAHTTDMLLEKISVVLPKLNDKKLNNINKNLTTEMVREMKKSFIAADENVKQLVKTNFEKFTIQNTKYPKILSMIKYILV